MVRRAFLGRVPGFGWLTAQASVLRSPGLWLQPWLFVAEYMYCTVTNFKEFQAYLGPKKKTCTHKIFWATGNDENLVK